MDSPRMGQGGDGGRCLGRRGQPHSLEVCSPANLISFGTAVNRLTVKDSPGLYRETHCTYGGLMRFISVRLNRVRVRGRHCHHVWCPRSGWHHPRAMAFANALGRDVVFPLGNPSHRDNFRFPPSGHAIRAVLRPVRRLRPRSHAPHVSPFDTGTAAKTFRDERREMMKSPPPSPQAFHA